MITVKKEGILLEKTALEFECEGVLNPAAIRVGEDVHMFYRAVAKGNYSSIGYCKLKGPFSITERFTKPIIFPELEYESHGIEDPRLVKIDDLYYLSYTVYDGINALGALSTSTDLVNWQKKGIIVPQVTYDEFIRLATVKGPINEKYTRYNQHDHTIDKQEENVLLWDKNLIFFPRRIHDRLYFLHRIKPDMQIVVSVKNIEELTEGFWWNYLINLDRCIVLTPKYQHEVSYIGGGCPPIETKYGWLIIYHGVEDTLKGYVYSACVALLDLNNPETEIARLPYPLFTPQEPWELTGEVNNVCFPTGTVLFDDTLYIYYGAADERIAYATVSLSALLTELLIYTKNNDDKK